LADYLFCPSVLSKSFGKTTLATPMSKYSKNVSFTFFALYRDAGYTSEDLYKYAGHSSPLVSERFYSAEFKESLKRLRTN
jgi:hypothetical protein